MSTLDTSIRLPAAEGCWHQQTKDHYCLRQAIFVAAFGRFLVALCLPMESIGCYSPTLVIRTLKSAFIMNVCIGELSLWLLVTLVSLVSLVSGFASLWLFRTVRGP